MKGKKQTFIKNGNEHVQSMYTFSTKKIEVINKTFPEVVGKHWTAVKTSNPGIKFQDKQYALNKYSKLL